MEMDFPSNKRIKLDPESSSDPFIILHSDLHSLIYQHFCGKDICELFKVSKHWDSRTSESPKEMEKVQLNIYERSSTSPSTRSLTALLHSKRMYQNLKMSICFAANEHLKFLTLEKFSSILCLDITMRANIVFKRIIPADFTLPKLKELRLEGKLPNTLFKNLKTLEKLSVICQYNDYMDFFDSIKDNKGLKVLELGVNFRSTFQKISFRSSKFKLKSVSFKVDYCWPEQLFVNNFLLFHSETLTSLSIRTFDSASADTILTKLPALKELTIHIIDEFNNFLINKTISSLKCNSIFDARKILKSLEGIENLEVNNYGKDVFRWVIKNLMQLKKLKFKHAKCNNIAKISAAYNKFKIDDAPVNEDIEIIVE